MSSQRCPSCGLVNWSDAPNCKRCDAPLQPVLNDEHQPAYGFAPERPPIGMGILMMVWGGLLLVADLYLLMLSGRPSPALAVVGGPMILIAGFLLMRGNGGAMAVYFLGMAVMGVSLVANHGPTGIAFLIFPALIGLLVGTRRLPGLAAVLMVLSCIGLVGVLLIPNLLGISNRVAWRDFRPAQGMFTVKMPSDPIARPSKTERFRGYTLTTHPYESIIGTQGTALYVVVDFSPALSLDGLSYNDILEAELASAVGNTNSTVVSKRNTTVNGYPAIEFEVRPPAIRDVQNPKVFGKVFMNSEHLYVMQILASESSELLANKETFLNPTFAYQAAASTP